MLLKNTEQEKPSLKMSCPVIFLSLLSKWIINTLRCKIISKNNRNDNKEFRIERTINNYLI